MALNYSQEALVFIGHVTSRWKINVQYPYNIASLATLVSIWTCLTTKTIGCYICNKNDI